MTSDQPDGSTPDPAAGPDPFAGPGWQDEARRRSRSRTSPDQVRRRSSRRRKRRRRRLTLLIGGGALLIALVSLAWLTYTGLRARSELGTVRSQAATLRSQIAAGDLTAAKATAHGMVGHARDAHDLTTGPAWWLAAHIPYLGDPAETVRVSTRSMAEVAGDALPRLVDASSGLDPATLRRADGSVNLAPLTDVVPDLNVAAQAMQSALAAVRSTSEHTWLGVVDHARTDLLAQVGPLTTTIVNADVSARVLPAILGANGPRSYLVAFQNEAELRATGGLPGAFAIVRADHGKVSFTRFESDSFLQGTVARGLDLGREFDRLYVGNGKSPYRTYLSSNVSPDFPDAARIWAAMWHAKTGGTVDGALTLDPTALSYLLAVTGPAELPDGARVSADNVVALTQQQAYLRFGDHNAERRAFLLDIARAVSDRLIRPGVDSAGLVRAAARAVTEHRLLLWTVDPPTQRLLASTTVGGTLPDGASPYAGLTLNNIMPSKLDYYSHVSLTRVSSGCGAARDVTVTISIRNDAPASVPPYVAAHRVGPFERSLAPTTSGTKIAYYATAGATFDKVTVNGKAASAGSGTERGHPVLSVDAFVPRTTTTTIVLHLHEPAGDGSLTTRIQPMVDPVDVHLEDRGCGS